jgi:hypothetical protein
LGILITRSQAKLKPVILRLLAIATLAAPLPVQAAKTSFNFDGDLMQPFGADVFLLETVWRWAIAKVICLAK